jgi:nitroreductase
MPTPDPDTLKQMHRWFAIECNNDAWDLLETDHLTDDEQQTLLSAAHASAFHWSRIGGPINRIRADMLLARVHARIGDHSRALNHAEAAVNGLDDPDSTDWDRAFGTIVLAQVAALNGRADQAQKARDAARDQASHLKGEERAALETEITKVTRMLENS